MFVLLSLSASSVEAADKPHLVFFMADDTGWNNVGWHNPDMLTPHADALVAEGVELDRHYAFVYCSPSRSSFMTGRLPYHVNQVILSDSAVDLNAPKESAPPVLPAARVSRRGLTAGVGGSDGHAPQDEAGRL